MRLLFILYFLLSTMIKMVYPQQCTCSIDQNTSSIWTLPWDTESTPKCDLRMSVNCRHQVSWVYYLQNMKDHNVSVLININTIKDCSQLQCQTKNLFYFANKTYQLLEFGSQQWNTGDWYSSKTNNTAIERNTLFGSSYLDLQMFGDNLKIYDNRGMYPQGHYGFVRSGNDLCSTAYSCSLLSTKLTNGIGYGEYVHGSIGQKEKVPYWMCFYLHFEGNDIQICADPINEQYARLHAVLKNNSFIHLQNKDVYQMLQPVRRWKSERSGNEYIIEWDIDLVVLNLKIRLKPVSDNSEFCILNNCFWIGSHYIINKGNIIGEGITEIFNFTHFSNSKKNFFYNLVENGK
jgi:hypothetical protein